MVQKLIILLTIASTLITGCNNNISNPKSGSPEAIVEAFNRAIAAGDFDSARQLCDTTSMDSFINNYHDAWNALMKEDSTILSIASGILSAASIEISKSEKKGHNHNIFYKIEANGKIKQRQATVRKEEGEWKIVAITDVV